MIPLLLALVIVGHPPSTFRTVCLVGGCNGWETIDGKCRTLEESVIHYAEDHHLSEGQVPLEVEKAKLHPIFVKDTVNVNVLSEVAQDLVAYAPASMEIALSVRNAYDDTQPFDFEVSTSATWVNLEIDMAGERENGIRYFNYSMVGGNDLIGDWDIEYSTERKDAAKIDRQGLRVLRRWDVLTLGGGVVSSHYRTPLEAIYEIRMASDDKALALTTDFADIHIWKLSMKREFGRGKFLPFIRGHLTSDNGNQDFKVKGGVKIIL
ncbi:hypothetical protein CL634_02835 [bacterium]|nr:hypothetical protein [bacterium]